MFQLVSTLVVVFLFTLALQQNRVDAVSAGKYEHPLFKGALKAIKDKECLGDYTGEVTMKHRIVSSCFAGGFIEEVTALPCQEGSCDGVKATAKVVYKCGVSTPHAKCL